MKINEFMNIVVLLSALDRRCKGDGKFLFWVADSHSKEGMKGV